MRCEKNLPFPYSGIRIRKLNWKRKYWRLNVITTTLHPTFGNLWSIYRRREVSKGRGGERVKRIGWGRTSPGSRSDGASRETFLQENIHSMLKIALKHYYWHTLSISYYLVILIAIVYAFNKVIYREHFLLYYVGNDVEFIGTEPPPQHCKSCTEITNRDESLHRLANPLSGKQRLCWTGW